VTRLYFASDIHGSDKCWLKFLSAAKYYEAEILMIGGDITGKFIVPIFKRADGGATAEFLGVKRTIDSPKALEKLKTQIANAGQYWVEVTPEEYANIGLMRYSNGLCLNALSDGWKSPIAA